MCNETSLNKTVMDRHLTLAIVRGAGMLRLVETPKPK
jgi:hypothetical protein